MMVVRTVCGESIARRSGPTLFVVALLLLQALPALATVGSPQGRDDNGIATNDTPIIISSGVEMAAAASLYGWSGTGSQSDPYIIEGMDFNGSGRSYCLSIENIGGGYVVIRNNVFRDTDIQYYTLPGDKWKNVPLGIKTIKNVTIENNTFIDNDNDIIHIQTTDCLIMNNTIVGGRRAIYTYSQYVDATIIGNNISGVDEGMVTQDGATIMHNTITGNDPHSGVGINGNYNGGELVINNTISNFSYGIRTNYGRFLGNTIRDCADVGIMSNAWTADNNTVVNSTVGLYLTGGANNLKDNRLTSAPIYVASSVKSELRRNSMSTSNTLDGKPIQYLVDGGSVDVRPDTYAQSFLVACSAVNLTGRTITGKFWLYTYFCGGVSVDGNDVDLGTQILWRLGAEGDVAVRNSTFSDVTLGIEGDTCQVMNCSFDEAGILSYVDNGTDFNNNTFRSRDVEPVQIGMGKEIHLADNEVTILAPKVGLYGLNIWDYLRNVWMRNNTLVGGGIARPWESPYQLRNQLYGHYDIDGSNTVNGRPILFLDDVSDQMIEGEYGQVIVNNSRNVVLRHLEMAGSDGGIGGIASTGVHVDHCVFEDMSEGAVSLRMCGNVNVTDSLFRGGNSYLFLNKCNYQNYEKPYGAVSGNYFLNITPSGQYVEAAINIVDSKLSELTSNYVTNISGHGIQFVKSALSLNPMVDEVAHNEVSKCTETAITGGTDDTIFHLDSFLDNGVDEYGAQCQGWGSGARWNLGRVGNYWSDYTMRYPTATNDGTTWDHPYRLGPGGIEADDFPLVAYADRVPPWAWIECNGTTLPGRTEDFSGYAIDNVGVTGYEWSFEENGTWTNLTGSDVTHAFIGPGDHTVHLKVRDSAGNTGEDWRVVHVLDNVPPVAVAGDDIFIDQGMTAELNGTGSYDDTGITSWLWIVRHPEGILDFTTPTVALVYDEAGTYQATLTVWDGFGNTDTDLLYIVVRDSQSPKADAGDDVTINEGGKVTFDGRNSTDNVGIVRYTWSFELRGEVILISGTDPNMGFTFLYPGVYNVTLTVLDAEGNVDTDNMTVTVLDITPPTAMAGDDVTVDQHTVVHLDSTGTNDNVEVVDLEWTFELEGETVTLGGWSPVFTFHLAGTYVVTLRVWDAAGHVATDTVNVTVRDTTPPEAVAGDDVTVDQGDTVDLDGSASWDNMEVVLHVWTLDYDGREVTRTGAIAHFTFDVPGVYNVTLTVTDMAGNTATDHLVVTVTDTKRPVAVAGPNVTVDQHTVVTFDGSLSTDNVGVVDFLWVFWYEGETRELTGVTPQFTFDAVGEYEVLLEVMDPRGNWADDNVTVTVLDTDLPVAVAGDDVTVQEGDTVHLDGSASTDNVGIVSWRWTFAYNGTQEELEGEAPSFAFRVAGNYTVTLTVADARGNTAQDTLVVNVQGPPGGGEPEPDDEGGLSVAVVGIALVVVVAVVLVAVVLWQRRR